MAEMGFEQRLLRDAAAMAYPPTPELQARVRAAIAMPPTPARRTPPVRPFAFVAIAAAVAVAVGVTLAVPPSREAVADFFGIEGSRVEPVPTNVPLPDASEIDARAVAISVDRLAAGAGFEPALPDDREPDSAYAVDYAGSPGVILRYPEFDLWEVHTLGRFEGYFGKGVPSPATITDTAVDGQPATWISGGPHLVEFIDERGGVPDLGDPRTVERNTLIWRTDAALYRVETELPLADAIAIAETLP